MTEGDYYEGFEEGYVVGYRDALTKAVAEVEKPAGNSMLDFLARQQIILGRVKRLFKTEDKG